MLQHLRFSSRLLARHPARRGQSLVEFALTLPVLLLIVLGTVDLGRAYFSAITLENAVKEGAFFGARNPECNTGAGAACGDPNNVRARVEVELDGVAISVFEAKCFAPGTAVFTGAGKALADCEDNDLYFVRTQAPFALFTPLIGGLVGDTITLTSSATAVVITSLQPLGSTPIPIPTTEPSATAAPGMCTVPSFADTKLGDAGNVWSNIAGFSASNISTDGPSGQKGTWQSVPAGTQAPCVSQTIIVSNTAQATPTPVPTPVPTAVPTPEPTLPPGETPAPTPTPAPPGTPTPTPAAQCTVPNMVNDKVVKAEGEWAAAGFQAANFIVTRPPHNPADYKIGSQSLAPGLSRACLTTAVTVAN